MIHIPTIKLEWTDWTPWDDLKVAARKGGINIAKKPGVYEVKYKDDNGKRLDVGKTTDLRRRIQTDLVKGTGKHSTGKRIRANEDTANLVVKWAFTDRPAAAEEDLHLKYKKKFGKLPKHVKLT